MDKSKYTTVRDSLLKKHFIVPKPGPIVCVYVHACLSMCVCVWGFGFSFSKIAAGWSTSEVHLSAFGYSMRAWMFQRIYYTPFSMAMAVTAKQCYSWKSWTTCLVCFKMASWFQCNNSHRHDFVLSIQIGTFKLPVAHFSPLDTTHRLGAERITKFTVQFISLFWGHGFRFGTVHFS